MVTIRTLLNPLILNNWKYEGFQGDSELIGEDGKLHLGYWTFLTSFDGWLRDVDYKSLDDEIDEADIIGKELYIEVFNDDEDLCGVNFNYKGDTNGNK